MFVHKLLEVINLNAEKYKEHVMFKTKFTIKPLRYDFN
jgi:hypothetical protein